MNDIYLKGDTGKGILLIHGYTGFIDELEELAKYVNKNGITVSLPILPGHNTTVQDLNKYKWRDWYNFIEKKYQELAENVKQPYIGGISMGGALALHFAAHNPTNGVIALATGTRLLDPYVNIIPIAKKFIEFFPKKESSGDVNKRGLKRKRKCYRYTSLKTVNELMKLFSHLKDDLPEIKTPVLYIHSLKDHTISYENAFVTFNRISSKFKEFVTLKKSYHLITMDIEKQVVFEETLKFLLRKKY